MFNLKRKAMDETLKKSILAQPQTDWIMDPYGRKQCDIKLLLLVSELLNKQKSNAEEQIVYLRQLLEFLEKMINKMLEEMKKT